MGRTVWAAVAAGLLGLLLYTGTAAHGYVFDDVDIVEKNPLAKDPAALDRIFRSHYWEGIQPASDLYRPLTVWSFAAVHAAAGPGAGPQHVVNAALHGAVSALVALLAAACGLGPAGAAAAGCLFAAHPIHAEAVAPVVGRSDLLAAFFALAAWLVLRSRAPAPAGRGPGAEERGGPAGPGVAAVLAGAVLFAASLLSKESAAVLPAAYLLFEFVAGPRPAGHRARPARGIAPERTTSAPLPWGRVAAATLVLLAVLGGWLALRAAVLPGIPAGDTAVRVFSEADAATRVRTALGVLGRYLGLMVFPLRLSADYSFDQIPYVASWSDPLVAGSAALHALLLAAGLALARRGRLSGGGLLFYLGALFPVSNLAFPIGTVMSERLLYLPSIGLCLLVPALAAEGRLARADSRVRAAAAALLVIAVGLMAARTLARVPDWKDAHALFSATVKSSPRSAKAWYNLGVEEEARGRYAEAIVAYERALAIKPDLGVARRNVGLLLLRAGRAPEAAEHLALAAQLDPDRLDAHRDLGIALQRMGRNPEAEAAYREEIRRRPGNREAPFNLGSLLLDLGRPAEALPFLERAAEMNPRAPDAHGRRVLALAILGRHDEAAAALEASIRVSPDFAASLPLFARVAAALGLQDLAARAASLGGMPAPAPPAAP